MAKRLRSEQSSNINKDRISELPVKIIRHILSLLPSNEAMMTTFLSSAWRDQWIHLPNLIFDKAFINQILENNNIFDRPLSHFSKLDPLESLKIFDFIDRTLTKRSKNDTINVASFSLYVPFLDLTPELSTYLDRWIDLVINKFEAEGIIFNNSSIRAPYNFVINAHFSTLPLKRLDLHRVTLGPELIECLSRHCPLIERLCFRVCQITDKFRVSGFPKLVEFVLQYHYNASSKVDLELIDVPNLRFLEYDTVGCCEIKVDTCDSLKDLRLRGVILRLSNLPVSLLSNLKLDKCKLDAEDVVISSNYLETLSIKGCTFSALVKVRIDAPSLKDFSYSGFIPPIFELNHLGLEKANFRWSRSRPEWDDPPYERLVDFLAKMNPCKELEIHTNSIKQELIFEPELRQNWNSPLSDVKHLKLGLYSRSWPKTRLSIDSFIDTVLWLCPRPLTITISLLRPLYVTAEEFKVLKLRYYEGGHEGAKKCGKCESLPVRCWEHHLEEVSIENHRADEKEVTYEMRRKMRTEDDNNIKAFFENAREKKIVVNIINS